MALISPMVRTALFVSNIDASAKFYQRIFELDEVYFEGELTSEAAAQLLGMPADSITQYKILRSQGLNKGMIGLFQISNPKPPAVSKDAATCNVGETCLVFYCADLDVITERLNAGGHAMVCPPTHLQVNETRGQREMTFRDPDGVMINLIEGDPFRTD